MQSQTSAPSSKEGGRGPSKVPALPAGQRFIIHALTAAGDPSEPVSTIAPYRTSIGVIVRENVPITYKSWKRLRQDPSYVPNKTKEMLWVELNKRFKFPEDKLEIAKKRALSNMANAWRH